ncbi:hypothetical protein [Bradyrhizobium sp. CIR3A]|uniref:hypothetical protein n=1 Tax=Bradyrhizobium sp. CIR3A TaxID=2663838 RepID=UPI0016061AA1|nr:hypothetical protein [Bradyrhizobium sp. CIR3A]MBB4263889.1 transposase InsO family protein [Bradyrhizobium sp. CIR3A]
MIRDMMVHCLEQRFAAMRAPRKVQRLTNNGSIFAAYRTLEIAAALNHEPASRRSRPESNSMAEAFVKTLKPDYVRVNPMPDASTALQRIDQWTKDSTQNTRTPGRVAAHPGSTLHQSNQPSVRGANSSFPTHSESPKRRSQHVH